MAPVAAELRARDVVVVRHVLPGPSCRVRAAGEIGEFAGARGRAPGFGAALASTGGKGEGGIGRPRPPAGVRDATLRPQHLPRSLRRITNAASLRTAIRPPAGCRIGTGARIMGYDAAAMTASS